MSRKQLDSTKKKISQSLKIQIDKEHLEKMCKDGFSAQKMADKIGVSKSTILKRLLEFNLETSGQKKKLNTINICSCGKEFRQVATRKYCPDCKYQEIKKLRKQYKIDLVEYKGGSCENCGYNKCIEALEFHHTDPNKKDFSISNNFKSMEKMKNEVDKCILLCSNCHREEHVRLRNINLEFNSK